MHDRTPSQRIVFHVADETFEVDFSNLTFSDTEQVDAFYDEIDRQLAASGRHWYFLVNYTDCVIAPNVWQRFAERGKMANISHGLGTVRIVSISQTRDSISKHAESAAFHPNIYETREQALQALAEMRAKRQRLQTVAVKSQLFVRVFSATVAAIVVLFVAMYLLSVPFIQATVESIEERGARAVLDSVCEDLKRVHQGLQSYRQSIILSRKAELQNIIAVVASRATRLETQVRAGQVSKDQARRMFLDELRHIQFGNKDYVWAANYSSVLISHPDPKLNNADFSKQKDVRGNLIVPPMVEGALTSGAGFYSYWWRRLGEELPIEKLSFYKHLPAFDLVIGTGIYMDDVETLVSLRRAVAVDDLRQQILSTRLAKTGYVYIFDNQANMLIHPNANIEGKRFAEMTDPVTKQLLAPMLIAAADKSDGVRYKWDSPSDPGNYGYEKISWVRHSSEFDWYVGSSVYVDELNESARILGNRLLQVFSLTILLSIALVYVFVKRLTNPLKILSATAQRVQDGDLDARCELRRDDEIGVVATAFNGMVARLQDNIQRLDAKVGERTAEREKAYEERKEVETKLSESEDYNKILFQESQIAMIVIDPQQGFIDCNRAAVIITGAANRDELLGSKLGATLSAPTQYDGSDSATEMKRHVRTVMEKGIDRFQWLALRPNGEIWDAQICLMKFNFHGRQLLQFTVQDITEQVKAEKERAELDRLKSDFLSTVSHELRTPMTSVVGFAKLIRKKLENSVFPFFGEDDKAVRAISQVRQNLDIIVGESERLSLLVNDVLDSSKLEAGKVEWNFVALSPRSLIERSTAVAATLAEQKGLALRSEVESDLPNVLGDENRLHQVLTNLIANAVKFTRHGQVVVRAERQDKVIRFCVCDSGIGIAEENWGSVFDKFRQVGDTLTDKPQGTGLGLSICQQIVKHHGGEIWLDSELGVGSNFYFTVPIENADQSGSG